jgi:hypothetical protein
MESPPRRLEPSVERADERAEVAVMEASRSRQFAAKVKPRLFLSATFQVSITKQHPGNHSAALILQILPKLNGNSSLPGR